MRALIPASLILLIVALVGAFAGGQVSRGSSSQVTIRFAPDPDALWNFMQDRSQPPYVVPAGKDLVITDGFAENGYYGWPICNLSINGVQSPFPIFGYGNGASGPPRSNVDPGIVAHPGDVVDLILSGNTIGPVGASGYLVDRTSNPIATRLEYTPRPEEMIYLDSQIYPNGYTVPAGFHLVIRDGSGTVSVNGSVRWEFPNGPTARLRSGILAVSGDVVIPGYGATGFLRPN